MRKAIIAIVAILFLAPAFAMTTHAIPEATNVAVGGFVGKGFWVEAAIDGAQEAKATFTSYECADIPRPYTLRWHEREFDAREVCEEGFTVDEQRFNNCMILFNEQVCTDAATIKIPVNCRMEQYEVTPTQQRLSTQCTEEVASCEPGDRGCYARSCLVTPEDGRDFTLTREPYCAPLHSCEHRTQQIVVAEVPMAPDNGRWTARLEPYTLSPSMNYEVTIHARNTDGWHTLDTTADFFSTVGYTTHAQKEGTMITGNVVASDGHQVTGIVHIGDIDVPLLMGNFIFPTTQLPQNDGLLVKYQPYTTCDELVFSSTVQ